MKKYLLIPTLTLFFVACGGSGGSSDSSSESSPVPTNNTVNVETTPTETTKNPSDTIPINSSTESTDLDTEDSTSTVSLKMAITNTGSIVKETFGDYVLQVVTSNILSESNETSQSTIAIYGTINGNATESLLKLNTNYQNSSVYVVVFKDEKVVGQSKRFTINNEDAINFGEITIK